MSVDELKEGIQSMGAIPSDEDIQAITKGRDIQKGISYPEFVKIVADLPSVASNLLKQKSGKKSKPRLTAASSPRSSQEAQEPPAIGIYPYTLPERGRRSYLPQSSEMASSSPYLSYRPSRYEQRPQQQESNQYPSKAAISSLPSPVPNVQSTSNVYRATEAPPPASVPSEAGQMVSERPLYSTSTYVPAAGIATPALGYGPYLPAASAGLPSYSYGALKADEGPSMPDVSTTNQEYGSFEATRRGARLYPAWPNATHPRTILAAGDATYSPNWGVAARSPAATRSAAMAAASRRASLAASGMPSPQLQPPYQLPSSVSPALSAMGITPPSPAHVHSAAELLPTLTTQDADVVLSELANQADVAKNGFVTSTDMAYVLQRRGVPTWSGATAASIDRAATLLGLRSGGLVQYRPLLQFMTMRPEEAAQAAQASLRGTAPAAVPSGPTASISALSPSMSMLGSSPYYRSPPLTMGSAEISRSIERKLANRRSELHDILLQLDSDRSGLVDAALFFSELARVGVYLTPQEMRFLLTRFPGPAMAAADGSSASYPSDMINYSELSHIFDVLPECAVHHIAPSTRIRSSVTSLLGGSFADNRLSPVPQYQDGSEYIKHNVAARVLTAARRALDMKYPSLKNAFLSLDVDKHTGKLGWNQFVLGVYDVLNGFDIDRPEVKALWDRYDTDNDGCLEFWQWAQMLEVA